MTYDQPTPIYSPINFDWVIDPALKTKIERAWNEYKQEPTESRYNHFWTLMDEVPTDSESVGIHELFDPVRLKDMW